jgi:hypothetical protein
VVTFGTSADADVRAAGVELDGSGRPAFDLVTPAGTARVTLPLHGRHHVSNALAAAAVAHLGAVQAQEFAEANWSIAERVPGAVPGDVEEAFTRGEILRVHALRPTWHYLAAADLRWIQALTGPRVHQANAYYYRQVGMDEATIARSNQALGTVLADGQPRTRRELGAALKEAGIEGAEGVRLAHLMMCAELDALVCSGPRRGKQHTYALLDRRAPPAPERARDDALIDLVTRFFTTHGPATIRDFTWWSGLTVADAKRGLAGAGDALEHELDDEGRPWYFPSTPQASPATKRPSSRAYLLPTYDEAIVAYKDLRVVFAEPPSREGPITRAVVIDGMTVGSWKRIVRARSVEIEAMLLSRLDADQQQRLAAAVDRFGRFMGSPATLSLRTAA